MRTAIFVDAGYVYAAGGVAISGEKLRRIELQLDVPKFVEELKERAASAATRNPLLRIYWYDGALSRGLSTEHKLLADLDDIKLRLGAISYSGRQKGVDSLIVTDLIDLARNRAISDAVLLSGDEDMRIGVQIAQSFGVRVHLVGIRVPDGNQSPSLKRESDTTMEWCREDVSGFLTRMPSSDVRSNVRGAEAGASGTDRSHLEMLTECVTEYLQSCSIEDLSTIAELGMSSPVPRHLDSKLLRNSSEKLERQLEEPEKHQLRKMLKEHARGKRG